MEAPFPKGTFARIDLVREAVEPVRSSLSLSPFLNTASQ
jgi:hypothetical protein